MNRLGSFKKLLGLSLVALTAVTSLARAADLTAAIPAKAKVVVLATDVSKMEKNLRGFADAIGKPLPPLELSQLLQQVGLDDVWQTERGMAVAAFDMSPDAVLGFMPVSDAAAALKALKAEKEGDSYKLTLPNGMDLVAMPRKDILVLANSAEAFAYLKDSTPLAQSLGAMEKNVFKEADIYVYVNVPALKEEMLAGLNKLEESLPMLLANPAMKDNRAMLEAVAKLYMHILRRLAEETKSFSMGMDVSPKAVRFGKSLVFVPNSKLASYFPGNSKQLPPAQLLSALPLHQFVMAGGAVTGDHTQLVLDFTDLALQTMAADADADAVAGMRANSKKMSSMIKGFDMLMMSTEDGIVTGGHYHTPQPANLLNLMRDMTKDYDKLKDAMPKGMAGKMKVEDHAVGGKEGMRLTMTFTDMPEESLQAIKAMYGSTTLTTDMVAGEKKVSFVQAGQEDPSKLFSTPVEGNLASMPKVKIALESLPEKATAVGLIDPAGYLQMLSKIMASMGQNLPLPTSKEAMVPVGFAVVAGEGGFLGMAAVRAETVKEIIALTEKAGAADE